LELHAAELRGKDLGADVRAGEGDAKCVVQPLSGNVYLESFTRAAAERSHRAHLGRKVRKFSGGSLEQRREQKKSAARPQYADHIGLHCCILSIRGQATQFPNSVGSIRRVTKNSIKELSSLSPDWKFG